MDREHAVHCPPNGSRVRRWVTIAAVWAAALCLYVGGAVRQSTRLNLSATAGGQYPYLLYAKGMAEEGWLGYLGDRNRMPLYPALLSLAYDEDWSTFVARSHWFAIGSSLVFLAIAVATIYLVLPPWPATALGLMAAFSVFLPKAAFVQAELAYYTFFLCSCVAFARLLLRPTRRFAVVAGLMAAVTYLTKASGLALLLAFVLTAAASVVGRCLPVGKHDARHGLAPALHECRKRITCTAVAVAVFLTLVYPYISTNKTRYGRWFYNVNSTFFMWCDSWTEAHAFALQYDIARQYPPIYATDVPGPRTYVQSHTWRQIAGRLVYGLVTLGRLSWRSAYLKYLILSAGLYVFAERRRRRGAHGGRADTRVITLFAVVATAGYVLGYAWYVPVAFGNRFVLSLFLPATMFLWWRAGASPPRPSDKPLFDTARSPRIPVPGVGANTIATWLIPVLLVEGAYAAAVRVSQPTAAFVRFYYNESLERLKAGDRDEAERGFRGVVQLDPNWGAPRRDLGMIALSAGRTDAAVAWLEEGTRLDPGHADGWNSLGGAYLAAQRETDAIAAFERATALDAKLATAWYNLGGACAQIGDRTRAQTALAHLRSLDHRLARQLENLLED